MASPNTPAFAICLFLTVFPAYAATYDDALKSALKQADILLCDSIDHVECIQDFCISLEQAQGNCRVAVTVAKGDPEACLKLNNKRSYPADVTLRHRCLDQLARSTHRAEICAMIPPEEESADEKWNSALCHAKALVSNRWCPPDAHGKQAQLFRDNCRLQAISDLTQCKEGFFLPEIRKRMNNAYECTLTVSVNMHNASICFALTAPDDRRNCEDHVKKWQKLDAEKNNSPSRTQ